ncbi:MAG TPA: hypothetical protein VGG64_13795 [Pirellulales bacterium]|jgi:hypothetical protein
MDRLTRSKLFAPLVLAATLALGAQGIWGFACMWTQAVIGAGMIHPVNESLEITRDGRALIRHMQKTNGMWRHDYRSLSGQEVSDATVNSATALYLAAPTAKPDWLNWNQRIQGFADTRNWPTYWFLSRDARAPGNAYFVLYDGQTRQLVGYFGPHGFRPDLPPADEQFSDVPQWGYAPILTAANYGGGSEWNRASAVYLIGNSKLWRIDIEGRAIQTVEVPDEPVSVAWLGTNEHGGPAFDRTKYRVVVRTRDNIALLDVKGATLRSFPIPAPLGERDIRFFDTEATDVVLTSHSTRGDADVYWIDEAGGADRHENVQISGMKAVDNESAAWLVALVVPAPLVEAFYYTTEAAGHVESGDAASMAEAFAQTFNQCWPAILAVGTLSALLAAVCYRHRRRYADRDGAAWALFVFLMGVPGAIGYWLHRQWPVTERCAHCGATAPRDRDGCLVCAAEFPAPELKGIEVFA